MQDIKSHKSCMSVTESYGNDQSDNFQRTATYVDEILKGAKPSELPVQVPVNKRTLCAHAGTGKFKWLSSEICELSVQH